MSDKLIGAASDRVVGHDEANVGPYGVEMPVSWDIEFKMTPSTDHGEEDFQKSKPVNDKKDE